MSRPDPKRRRGIIKRIAVTLTALGVLLAACAIGCRPTVHVPLESASFIVYYPRNDKKAAQDVLRVLEEHHDRIVNNLKPNKDTPYTVRIYPNQEEFLKAVNRPDWPESSVGTAWGDSELRIVSPRSHGRLFTYQEMLQVAVHEFTHCVTLRVTGGKPPKVWLWESIALYEAGQFRDPQQYAFMQSGEVPQFMSVTDQIKNPEIYAIGYTVLEYIVDFAGMDVVRQLILHGGDVGKVLGMTDDQFYDAWYAFVRAKYLK